MTTQAPPLIEVTCAFCKTKNGRPRLLCKVASEYAVIEQPCDHCKRMNTRIVVAGVMLESRA